MEKFVLNVCNAAGGNTWIQLVCSQVADELPLMSVASGEFTIDLCGQEFSQGIDQDVCLNMAQDNPCGITEVASGIQLDANCSRQGSIWCCGNHIIQENDINSLDESYMYKLSEDLNAFLCGDLDNDGYTRGGVNCIPSEAGLLSNGSILNDTISKYRAIAAPKTSPDCDDSDRTVWNQIQCDLRDGGDTDGDGVVDVNCSGKSDCPVGFDCDLFDGQCVRESLKIEGEVCRVNAECAKGYLCYSGKCELDAWVKGRMEDNAGSEQMLVWLEDCVNNSDDPIERERCRVTANQIRSAQAVAEGVFCPYASNPDDCDGDGVMNWMEIGRNPFLNEEDYYHNEYVECLQDYEQRDFVVDDFVRNTCRIDSGLHGLESDEQVINELFNDLESEGFDQVERCLSGDDEGSWDGLGCDELGSRLDDLGVQWEELIDFVTFGGVVRSLARGTGIESDESEQYRLAQARLVDMTGIDIGTIHVTSGLGNLGTYSDEELIGLIDKMESMGFEGMNCSTDECLEAIRIFGQGLRMQMPEDYYGLTTEELNAAREQAVASFFENWWSIEEEYGDNAMPYNPEYENFMLEFVDYMECLTGQDVNECFGDNRQVDEEALMLMGYTARTGDNYMRSVNNELLIGFTDTADIVGVTDLIGRAVLLEVATGVLSVTSDALRSLRRVGGAADAVIPEERLMREGAEEVLDMLVTARRMADDPDNAAEVLIRMNMLAEGRGLKANMFDDMGVDGVSGLIKGVDAISVEPSGSYLDFATRVEYGAFVDCPPGSIWNSNLYQWHNHDLISQVRAKKRCGFLHNLLQKPRETIVIGRSADNIGGTLYSGKVSREHATLDIDRGSNTIVISDNGSTNGTFVNGRKLMPGEEVILQPGDVVGFGDQQINAKDLYGRYNVDYPVSYVNQAAQGFVQPQSSTVVPARVAGDLVPGDVDIQFLDDAVSVEVRERMEREALSVMNTQVARMRAAGIPERDIRLYINELKRRPLRYSSSDVVVSTKGGDVRLKNGGVCTSQGVCLVGLQDLRDNLSHEYIHYGVPDRRFSNSSGRVTDGIYRRAGRGADIATAEATVESLTEAGRQIYDGATPRTISSRMAGNYRIYMPTASDFYQKMENACGASCVDKFIGYLNIGDVKKMDQMIKDYLGERDGLKYLYDQIESVRSNYNFGYIPMYRNKKRNEKYTYSYFPLYSSYSFKSNLVVKVLADDGETWEASGSYSDESHMSFVVLDQSNEMVISMGNSGDVGFDLHSGYYHLVIEPYGVEAYFYINTTDKVDFFLSLKQEYENSGLILERSEKNLNDVGFNLLSFNDSNGNDLYDEGEEKFSDQNALVRLRKIYSPAAYRLDAGWSLISYPLLNEDITASKLIKEINNQGGMATTVAKYENGKWTSYKVRGNNVYSDDDFSIKRGQGYMIKNDQATLFLLSGEVPDNSAEMEMTGSWNLLAIHPGIDQRGNLIWSSPEVGEDGKWDSGEVLESLKASGIEADTISDWSGGRYKNYIQQEDQKYGFEYDIDILKGYFIRVNGEYKDKKWKP